MVPVREGEVLAGKYRVDRVLGAGGMGVVVLATHTALEQQVALKFLLPDALANPEVSGRFLREARAAVKLRSEHVAKVLDVGTLESGAPYIVMEYLDGRDLDQYLAARGPLPLGEIAEFVIQACDAIAEAHALGIVHRDLKPANLFVTQRADGAPLVKVLDFGISKSNALHEAHGALTKTSTVMGSPSYMSPEQMKSSKDVDARADVWSLGVILFQLATGRLPFEAESLGGLMAKVFEDPPDPLTLYRSDLPPAFQTLVARCLERDRSRRVASVAEVATALAPFAPPRALGVVERVTSLVGKSRAGSAAPAPTTSVAAVTPMPLARSGTEIGEPIALQRSSPTMNDQPGAWQTSQTRSAKPSRAGAIGVAIAATLVIAVGVSIAGVKLLGRAHQGGVDIATSEAAAPTPQAPATVASPQEPIAATAAVNVAPSATPLASASGSATVAATAARVAPARPAPAPAPRSASATRAAAPATAEPAPKKAGGLMDTPE